MAYAWDTYDLPQPGRGPPRRVRDRAARGCRGDGGRHPAPLRPSTSWGDHLPTRRLARAVRHLASSRGPVSRSAGTARSLGLLHPAALGAAALCREPHHALRLPPALRAGPLRAAGALRRPRPRSPRSLRARSRLLREYRGCRGLSRDRRSSLAVVFATGLVGAQGSQSLWAAASPSVKITPTPEISAAGRVARGHNNGGNIAGEPARGPGPEPHDARPG